MDQKYVLGVDFGSLSARAVLFDVRDGAYIDSVESLYEHGIIDQYHPVSNAPLPPASALQMPGDFSDSLEQSVRGVLQKTGIRGEDIVAMSVDATSCSLMALDENYRPMCEQERFKNSRHAYVKMWKQHTAAKEAELITALAGEEGERFGGKLMSEWGIPKILETLHEDPELYDATYRFMEMGDWVIYLLTGVECMSYCSAGLKFMWTPEKGYPSPDFFATLDERFRDVEKKLVPAEKIVPMDCCIGAITKEAAARTGLREGTPVAPMRIDGHSSVVAVGCHLPGRMDMILGTSMGLELQDPGYHPFPGISGACYGAMAPKLYAYESGLSGCGDIFQWFADQCVPAEVEQAAAAEGKGVLAYLSEKMVDQKPGQSGLIALDWWNGNRAILSDERLTGMIMGMTLQTRPEEMLRAIFEATGYGARMVVEEFGKNQMPVKEIVAVGGIAEKNAILIQMYADIIGCDIIVSDVKQACALGTAIYAAVAAGRAGGGYDTIEEAVEAMGALGGRRFTPDPENHRLYDRLFEIYRVLHDVFGRGGMPVMKELLDIKAEMNRA